MVEGDVVTCPWARRSVHHQDRRRPQPACTARCEELPGQSYRQRRRSRHRLSGKPRFEYPCAKRTVVCGERLKRPWAHRPEHIWRMRGLQVSDRARPVRCRGPASAAIARSSRPERTYARRGIIATRNFLLALGGGSSGMAGSDSTQADSRTCQAMCLSAAVRRRLAARHDRLGYFATWFHAEVCREADQLCPALYLARPYHPRGIPADFLQPFGMQLNDLYLIVNAVEECGTWSVLLPPRTRRTRVPEAGQLSQRGFLPWS